MTADGCARGEIIALVTSRYTRPVTLEQAVMLLGADRAPIRVVVPLLLPFSLPAGAYPTRSATRIALLRATAMRTLAAHGLDGDVRIVRGADITDVLRCGADGVDVRRVAFVGAASRALRRIAACIAQPRANARRSGASSAACD